MQEKTEKPTRKKLRDAKKRGEVSKSPMLTQAISFGFALVAIVALAPIAWRWFRDLFETLATAASAAPAEDFFWAAFQWMVIGILVAFAAVPLAACLGAVVGAFLQVRGVFSFQVISPKFQRLNPGENLKNLFSIRQLFELLKSLLKLAVLGTVLFQIIKSNLPDALRAQETTAYTLVVFAATLLLVLAFAALLVSLLISVVDYAHQRFEFLKKQRMSRQELRYEYKDVEGDPLIRIQRKRLHRAFLQGAVRQQVERASVVVTNPNHVAVGIRYVRGETEIPLVVVKGLDELAMRIRTLAEEMAIPVVRSPALARSLYERTEEEEFIAAEFFEAVAVIVAASQPEED